METPSEIHGLRATSANSAGSSSRHPFGSSSFIQRINKQKERRARSLRRRLHRPDHRFTTCLAQTELVSDFAPYTATGHASREKHDTRPAGVRSPLGGVAEEMRLALSSFPGQHQRATFGGHGSPTPQERFDRVDRATQRSKAMLKRIPPLIIACLTLRRPPFTTRRRRRICLVDFLLERRRQLKHPAPAQPHREVHTTRHILLPRCRTTDEPPQFLGDSQTRVVRRVDPLRRDDHGPSKYLVLSPIRFRTRQALQRKRYRQFDMDLRGVATTGRVQGCPDAFGTPVGRKHLAIPEEPFDASLRRVAHKSFHQIAFGPEFDPNSAGAGNSLTPGLLSILEFLTRRLSRALARCVGQIEWNAEGQLSTFRSALGPRS